MLTWSNIHSILWYNNYHIWNWVPPAGTKIYFNLLDDEYFTISYVIDTIPNSPDSHQLPTQAKKNVWVIAINVEYSIIDQDALDELQRHETPCGKSKVKISICRRRSYQRTYLEYIWSRFYQVRPLVSHLEVHLPEKSLTPKNIGEDQKGPQRQSW